MYLFEDLITGKVHNNSNTVLKWKELFVVLSKAIPFFPGLGNVIQ